MKTLAVIPARGGSKGLPGKNIRTVAGKPLIAWSIESAQRSRCLDRVVVSTDSAAIADVAARYGCEVLIRPDALAADDTTTIAVINHIAAQLPEFDTFVVLQPTSPLRSDDLIDRCVQNFAEGGFDNLATGYFCKMREFGSHNNERRQDYQGFFYDDGSVYVLTRALVESGRWFGDRIGRYIIPKEQSFEIDDEVDEVVLEALLTKYGKRP